MIADQDLKVTFCWPNCTSNDWLVFVKVILFISYLRQ